MRRFHEPFNPILINSPAPELELAQYRLIARSRKINDKSLTRVCAEVRGKHTASSSSTVFICDLYVFINFDCIFEQQRIIASLRGSRNGEEKSSGKFSQLRSKWRK